MDNNVREMFCAYCGQQLEHNGYGYIDCCGVGYLCDIEPLPKDRKWGIMKRHGLHFYPNTYWDFSWKVAEPKRLLDKG